MLFLYLVACGEKKLSDTADDSNSESIATDNMSEEEQSQSSEEQPNEGNSENTENTEDEESEEGQDSDENRQEEDNDNGENEDDEEDEDEESEEVENTDETIEEDDSSTGNELCDVEDLVWNVRVVDDNQSSISPYSTTSPLSIIGEVTNNCDGELTLSTMTDCIVYSGTLYANSGLGTHIWTNTCQVFSSSWVFAPFETKSQTETIASRPSDHYELVIYFADSQTTMVEYSFDVE